MHAKPLRVLVVLPMYGGSLPVGHYCASALKDLGHTVTVFDAPAFYGAFSALKGLGVTTNRFEQLEAGFLHTLSQAIFAQVETFEPDLVLALAQAPVSRQLLRRLAREGVTTAMWFVEDHNIFTYWRAFAPLYTVFAVIQQEPFLSRLAEVGQKNALYLPMAALPDFHKTLQLSAAQEAEFGADIAFVGAGYPNRRVAFRAFARRNFKIWGTEWDGENALAGNVQRGGARIDPETCVTIYNATKVNINLHSSVQNRELVPAGDFVNPRTFELAAIGAFQLVDARGLMPELFAEDSLATFTNMDELIAKAEHFLAHPEARAAYAARAKACVLARHTYQHRMQTLIEYIHKVTPNWPRPRKRALPENLPESLRVSLGQLLDTLCLPPDTPFEDVIARLRQRSGTLTDVETSLLFLDEWRKQYS